MKIKIDIQRDEAAEVIKEPELTVEQMIAAAKEREAAKQAAVAANIAKVLAMQNKH